VKTPVDQAIRDRYGYRMSAQRATN